MYWRARCADASFRFFRLFRLLIVEWKVEWVLTNEPSFIRKSLSWAFFPPRVLKVEIKLSNPAWRAVAIDGLISCVGDNGGLATVGDSNVSWIGWIGGGPLCIVKRAMV